MPCLTVFCFILFGCHLFEAFFFPVEKSGGEIDFVRRTGLGRVEEAENVVEIIYKSRIILMPHALSSRMTSLRSSILLLRKLEC